MRCVYTWNTESIKFGAQAWGEKFLREGDVILLTEMEHHSNLVPWQLLAERIGVDCVSSQSVMMELSRSSSSLHCSLAT
jgi:selenocysteine lyase/cysteine desulfurase